MQHLILNSQNRKQSGCGDLVMDLKAMIDSLSEIGCTDEERKTAKMLYDSDRYPELIRYLKKCRCGLIEQMHDSQRKVDRMDLLIRKAEKESV